MPGLEKKKKPKHSENIHSFTPTCPYPQLLAGSPAMSHPPFPGGWVPQGGREDSQSWAGPRKSHLIDLRGGVGWGWGADEMNGKKKEKKNPGNRTAHVDLLVPEAKVRSQVADHALRWGVGGQAGGRTDSTGGAGEPPSHHGEAGGAGGPAGLFIAGYVLLSAWWGTSSQSPLLS